MIMTMMHKTQNTKHKAQSTNHKSQNTRRPGCEVWIQTSHPDLCLPKSEKMKTYGIPLGILIVFAALKVLQKSNLDCISKL